MKFRYLMMSLLAVSALAAGCKEEEEDLGLPQVTVAGDGITFDATTKKASLEAGEGLSSYKTTVTANRPWTVDVTYGSAEKDWIAATPDHGNASTRPQEVVLTLLPNEGRDRTATVKYNIGYDYKTLIIKQKGALGSIEDATLYANNFDKEVATQTFGSGSSWPFLDQFDGWQNETGIGAANATYDYSGMSVRNNSNSNGTYSDYEGSGVNNLFFGNGGYITIGNIDISASNNLHLTFGTEKYLGSGDSTFNPDEFTVSLSGNGTDWSKPIAYNFAGEFKSGRWDLATADFTVPEDVKTLYIRFAASVASAYRLDDVTLTIGDGGDLIELTGGSDNPGGDNPGGGDQPSGDAIYGNNFDKEAATQTFGSGSSWPYLDQFDGWQNESGTGASGVTYSYSGMSTRNNSNSNGNYSDYAGSGLNNIFFGASAYFTIEKIDISSSNNLHLTFGTEKYLGSGDSTFNPAEFTVTLSGDGESWSAPIAYSFPNGNKSGRWDLATADFTVPENVKTLYIKFSASVASAYRIDDVSLTAGEGGDFVDLTGGTTDPDPGTDPTPGTGSKFESDAIFVCSADDSPNASYTLGATKINGQSSSGFKLGTSSKIGKFTSAPVNVEGDYTLSFYGVAWKGQKGTVKISVSGGGSVEGSDTFELRSNDGATGNPAFTITLDETADHYSVVLKGLTKTSTVTFETVTNAFRAVVAGVHLTEGTDGGSTDPGTGGDEPAEVKAVTVSEFNAAPESDTQVYELTGRISGSINTTYGNFDLVDDSGSVYVYGLTATELGYGATNDKSYKSLDLNAGDVIKIRGYRGSYDGKIEVMYAWFIEKLSSGSTDPGTGGDEPAEVKTVTVAQFNAAPESDTQVYELTGTISGSINTTYGNFDLVDDSGSVYVYGLTATNLGYGAKNDNSYASLGLNAGDVIKIRGYRGSYNGKIEVMYAWFIEKLSSGSTDPGTDPTPGTGSKFESDAIFVCSADDSPNASYTLGATKINGQSSSGFKLGTSSKIGKFTSAPVNVEGDYTLSFYGVAWKGQKGTVKISVSGGGSVEGSDTFELRSNDGATGNPAFTISLDEMADHYSVVLKGLTKTSTVTFETVTNAYRAVVAGIHLTDDGTTGGGSTDPGTGEETTSSFDFSAQGYENGSEVTSVTFGPVTVTFDKGSNSNTPKYYSSGTSVRVYGGGTITVEAGGKTITGIKFTYGTSDQTNEITADSGTFSTDTWTGSATSVTFTIGGTSGHRRVKAIEVSYK